jgi:hypothetical protein
MKAKALSYPKNFLTLINSLNTKVLFFVFATLLVGTFLCYVYLVNATIMNVVAREQIETNISDLSTTIGTLEYKYISLKNAVTIDLAHAKGFTDASPTSFLARKDAAPALSYNGAR